MAKEMKIAHDYFLDCCKKYGVEVVSDRVVRSHFVTICRFEGIEHKVDYFSVYGQGKEKKLGMHGFKTMMAGHYLDKEPRDLDGYDRWANNKEDILYEPKPKGSDLEEIHKLIIKALGIVKQSEKGEIPESVKNALLDAEGCVSVALTEKEAD